jgi:cell division protein DivIC
MDLQSLKRFFNQIIKNKYLLTIFIFLVWLSFFDSDSFYDRYRNIKELKALKAEKEMYIQQVGQDRIDLEKMQDREYLEKFAREEHLMKKDNEDLFVIIHDD